MHLDERFGVLRNLRGSPLHFEKCKKDLFALIGQSGIPHGSVNFLQQKQGGHILKILGRLAEKKELASDEINNLT